MTYTPILISTILTHKIAVTAAACMSPGSVKLQKSLALVLSHLSLPYIDFFNMVIVLSGCLALDDRK